MHDEQQCLLNNNGIFFKQEHGFRIKIRFIDCIATVE